MFKDILVSPRKNSSQILSTDSTLRPLTKYVEQREKKNNSFKRGISMNKIITKDELESYLLQGSAVFFRNHIDAGAYKQFIFSASL